MNCVQCDGLYIPMESGELYCPDCGHVYVTPALLERPSDLENCNPAPKGGWSNDIRDDLPY